MSQDLALRILLAGHSALLTGPAGSGKTYVLAEFIRRSKKAGKSVAVTATTGLAATHLSGSTIHSWSGIGIETTLAPSYHQALSDSRQATIAKANILIIDEISMLHDYRLGLVDQITKGVRADPRPFGGLQVVLCGDFFQLPPINRAGERQGGFVVGSPAWQSLSPAILYLDEQHRQDDQGFLSILGALRRNDIDADHVESLQERFGVELGDDSVTELYTNNIDVDTINTKRLAAIPGKEYRYAMSTSGKASYVESLKRSCLAPQELVLKQGALVMCIRNNPEAGFVNGSLGTVEGFDTDSGYPIVKLRSGKTLTMFPETWELRDGETKRASLMQLPLRLAWAITVHKSQGMTLDAARIDLGKAFVPGMGYVALSRVRSLSTLSLKGMNRMALTVSEEAIRIDEQLRAQSAEAAIRFNDLPDLKDEAEPELKSEPTEWTDRLAKMREKHRNAYQPWTGNDDLQLKSEFLSGMGLKKLTKLFGRQPGSIRARLHKHFGEDITIPK